MAPSPTANVKIGGSPLMMNDPSPATKPPMKAATSVTGDTVVMASAKTLATDWLVAPFNGTLRRALAVANGMRGLVGIERVAPSLKLPSLLRWQQKLFGKGNSCRVVSAVRRD